MSLPLHIKFLLNQVSKLNHEKKYVYTTEPLVIHHFVGNCEPQIVDAPS